MPLAHPEPAQAQASASNLMARYGGGEIGGVVYGCGAPLLGWACGREGESQRRSRRNRLMFYCPLPVNEPYTVHRRTVHVDEERHPHTVVPTRQAQTRHCRARHGANELQQFTWGRHAMFFLLRFTCFDLARMVERCLLAWGPHTKRAHALSFGPGQKTRRSPSR